MNQLNEEKDNVWISLWKSGNENAFQVTWVNYEWNEGLSEKTVKKRHKSWQFSFAFNLNKRRSLSENRKFCRSSRLSVIFCMRSLRFFFFTVNHCFQNLIFLCYETNYVRDGEFNHYWEDLVNKRTF